MDSPGYIILSRLVAQTRSTAVTANNIANADTPGFRAERPLFGTVLERQRAADVPAGGRDLAFAQDRATWRDTAPGPLNTTGNPLDLALSAPEGFFVLQTPRGERYTRAGRFTLDAQNRVVDPEGSTVLNLNGQPISVAQGDARIEVMGDGTLRTENGPVGRLRIVSFSNPQTLNPEGDRLFSAPPDMPGQPVDRPGVVQGATEGSNVRPVVELTRMTEELREFQFATQMVESEGQRLGSAVERILGKR